jgi:hypothetical protein
MITERRVGRRRRHRPRSHPMQARSASERNPRPSPAGNPHSLACAAGLDEERRQIPSLALRAFIERALDGLCAACCLKLEPNVIPPDDLESAASSSDTVPSLAIKSDCSRQSNRDNLTAEGFRKPAADHA